MTTGTALNTDAREMMNSLVGYLADVSDIITTGGYQEFCDEFGAVLFVIYENEDNPDYCKVEVDGSIYNVRYDWLTDCISKIGKTIEAINAAE